MAGNSERSCHRLLLRNGHRMPAGAGVRSRDRRRQSPSTRALLRRVLDPPTVPRLTSDGHRPCLGRDRTLRPSTRHGAVRSKCREPRARSYHCQRCRGMTVPSTRCSSKAPIVGPQRTWIVRISHGARSSSRAPRDTASGGARSAEDIGGARLGERHSQRGRGTSPAVRPRGGSRASHRAGGRHSAPRRRPGDASPGTGSIGASAAPVERTTANGCR